MTLQQAGAASRVHQQWFQQEAIIEQGLLTAAVQQAREAMGCKFKPPNVAGATEAVLIGPRSGMRQGANDRRRPVGLAIATDESDRQLL